ncbi:hypothetical protein IL306_013918 [Fusarium sp. DS 682]|nr:hypothetical protein IL306_013918 [Fusarium sp. DS 682]
MSSQVSGINGRPFPLTNLPPEIIQCVVDNMLEMNALDQMETWEWDNWALPEPKHNPLQRYEDALNLAVTCKDFHKLLNGQIYRRDVQDNQSAAFLISAKRNNIAGAKRALEAGADINSGDMTESVTYYKVGLNVPKKGHRVPINLRDQVTALHWAAYNGHEEMVYFLLDSGADINHRVRIDSAEWHNHQRIPSSKPFMNSEPLDHYTLRFASKAVTDSVWLAKDCLQGVDEQYRTMALEQGANPLYFAIQSGNVDMADFLIAKGANFITHTGIGLNALHQAASNGDIRMVKLFLEEGIDPDVRDPFGCTPLHFVECHRLGMVPQVVKIIKTLVHYGADINSWDIPGRTPLLRYLVNSGDNNTVIAAFIRQGAWLFQGIYEYLASRPFGLGREIYDALADAAFPGPAPFPPGYNIMVQWSDTRMSLYCHFYELVERGNKVPSDLAELFPSEWEEYWEKRPFVYVVPPLLGGLMPEDAGNLDVFVEEDSDDEDMSNNDSGYASS